MPDNGTTPQIDVAAITKSVTEEVTKALGGQIAELAKNQKILADTYAADQAKAAEAAKAVSGGVKKEAEAAASVLTPEAIQKQIADGIATALKARDDAAAAKSTRQATIDKLTKEKLGGSPNLGKLLTGSTDEELTAQAEALAAEAKALKPDFGTNANGGKSVNDAAAAPAPGNLSPGQAAYAKSIKLPA